MATQTTRKITNNKKASPQSKTSTTGATVKRGNQTNRKTSTSSTKSASPTKNTKQTGIKTGLSKGHHEIELTMVQYEIIMIFILALSLFTIICVYFNSGGFIGDFVTRLFFGIFGIGAWLLPIAMFVATFIKVFNKGNQRLNSKLGLLFVCVIFISVSAHSMMVEYPQIQSKLSGHYAMFASLSNYYKISATHHVGGGFIGALVGDLFLFALGKIGTTFVLIIIFIMLFIAITEQSFLTFLKNVYHFTVNLLKKGFIYVGDKSESYRERKELEALENDPPTKKQHFIASLFKSTLDKDDFDLEKHIEEKEALEALQKNETDLQPLEEADEIKEARRQLLERAMLDQSEQQSEHIEVAQGTDEFAADNFLDTSEFDMYTGFEQDQNSSEFDINQEFEPILDEDNHATQAPEPIVKPEVIDVKKEKILVEQEVIKEIMKVEVPYKKPPLELLKPNPEGHKSSDTQYLKDRAKKLEETLASFGVGAKVVDISVGPTVTRYELQPDQGVKVSKIVNLADDIALNLAASGIRIEAPIPGKSAVGIEVPNKDVSSVYLREVIDSKEFDHFTSKVAFALGKDISGKVIVTDIAKMPHLLIAGATGSGKSICVNSLITSILYKASPEEVKLLMIDPKMVELSIYNGIPHLLIPVVTDAKKAAGALNWAVQEMLERYKAFASVNVRDMKSYNQVAEEDDELKKMPQIVIIVDELADLMVVASHEVEEAICRLAQMARAAGLHLIIATQRPSVDVITGLIKANIPSRIAFNVSSGIDSRTIIDMNGAEKLLGKGDMLFYPVGLNKPLRVQGAFVSDKEVENIVTFLKNRKREEYDEKIMKQLDRSVSEETAASEEYDPIFEDALALCVEKQKASASMIQRVFRVGYNRAARILDQLEGAGYVSEDEGSKPRRVLLTKVEFEALKAKANGNTAESVSSNSNHDTHDVVQNNYAQEEL